MRTSSVGTDPFWQTDDETPDLTETVFCEMSDLDELDDDDSDDDDFDEDDFDDDFDDDFEEELDDDDDDEDEPDDDFLSYNDAENRL